MADAINRVSTTGGFDCVTSAKKQRARLHRDAVGPSVFAENHT